jgi:hypothetical protein
VTQAIFIAAWFVGVIAWFLAMRSFMPWWFAKIRGAEPPEDALGKTLYAGGIFILAAAVGIIAGVIGEFTGGWG